MELTVGERMVVWNLLPVEANIVTHRAIQKAKVSLAFTDDEKAAAGIVEVEGGTRWNPDNDVVAEIEVGEVVTNIIVEALKKLNDEDKLPDTHVSLYEKFVEQAE